MKKERLCNQLRIIAGKWRGRKLSFPSHPSLRPTPNRIRETLFNWLAPVIVGSRCLDLFAGSGALGFEALSRNAREVIFVDSDKKVIASLHHYKALLLCENLEIHWMSAEQYLQHTLHPFNLIFLDPPFSKKELLLSTLSLIRTNKLLAQNGMIYIEIQKNDPLRLAHEWKILKKGTAGKIEYCLIGLD